MAAFTTQRAGAWGDDSATGPWRGGSNPASGVPGNGDTVDIKHAITITLGSVTIGTSGAAGTAAITMSATAAQLTVAAGTTLICRGDIVPTASSFTVGYALVVNGTFEWDSSQASSPATTHYKYAPNPGWAYWAGVKIQGSGWSNQAIVRSNPGGGRGWFDISAATYGMPLYMRYAACTDIDNGSTWAFNPGFAADYNASCDIESSVFTRCGKIGNSSTRVSPITTLNLRFNWFRECLHADALQFRCSSTTTPSATRRIEWNIIEAGIGDAVECSYLALNDNYIGKNLAIDGVNSLPWSSFARNLLISAGANNNSNGDLTDNYIFGHGPTDHGMEIAQANAGAALTVHITGNVLETTDHQDNDTNDGFCTIQAFNALTIYIERNVMPMGRIDAAGALAAVRQQLANVSMYLRHNTVMVGGLAGISLQGALLNIVSTAAGFSNLVVEVKDNIIASSKDKGCVVVDMDHLSSAPNLTVDVVTPAGVANNCRWRLSDSSPGSTWLTNQGNGYIAAFSAPLGASDLVTDPQFIDYTRCLALYDSVSLGRQYAEWLTYDSAHAFTAGDYVTHSVPGVWGGRAINYRCIAACTPATANSEPGTGSSWKTYWEPATLASIRADMLARMQAGTTGAGLSPIGLLREWVANGYAPTAAALKAAGTDSEDIGARGVTGDPPGAQVGGMGEFPSTF